MNSEVVDSSPHRETLIEEIVSLRHQLSEINEQRESDRKSLLILQNQIDSMRDAKCSDSFETSLGNLSAVARILWNHIPSVSISKLFGGSRTSSKRVKAKSDRSSKSHVSKVRITKESIVDPIIFRVAKDGARDA
jgi:hypothetical protein